MRLLLVQYDNSIALQIVALMQLSGHEVDWASNEYEAELGFRCQSHDLVLLDFGDSRLDSFDLLGRYRKRRGNAAVVALIPRGLLESPMVVLDAGADDYVMKPFELEDLRVRVRLVMRRSHRIQGLVALGNLSVNQLDCSVLLDGTPVPLKPSEYRLLSALINDPTRVFTRSELALHLYGRPRPDPGNVVDVVIHGLRHKLGVERIVTVRGVGYRMCQIA